MYRDHRVGPPAPGGHMGCRGCALAYMGQGHQPQEAHAPGETLKEESQQGKAPPRCLGGEDSSPGRRPLGDWISWGLAHPPPLGIPIYSGVGGPPKHTLCLWCSPSLSPKFSSSSPMLLGEALRDCHAPPPPPRRCAAAGWGLPQPLPLSLLDQGVGDVTGLYVC